jgi:hypothetical protein
VILLYANHRSINIMNDPNLAETEQNFVTDFPQAETWA